MKQNSYPRPGILRTTLYPNDFKRNVTSYHAMSILLKIKDRKVLPSDNAFGSQSESISVEANGSFQVINADSDDGNSRLHAQFSVRSALLFSLVVVPTCVYLRRAAVALLPQLPTRHGAPLLPSDDSASKNRGRLSLDN